MTDDDPRRILPAKWDHNPDACDSGWAKLWRDEIREGFVDRKREGDLCKLAHGRNMKKRTWKGKTKKTEIRRQKSDNRYSFH
jgi:hypothetical protein